MKKNEDENNNNPESKDKIEEKPKEKKKEKLEEEKEPIEKEFEETNDKEKSPEIDLVEGEDFSINYITGVLGGLNPAGGRIGFYQDRVIPEVGDKENNKMQIKKVKRELKTEIHMSPVEFKNVAKWMIKQLKQYEEKYGEIGPDTEEDKEKEEIKPIEDEGPGTIYR